MSGWPALPLGTAGALLADAEMAALFAPEAEIEAILAFERALARAQHGVGEIGAEALAAIEAACRKLVPDAAALAEGLGRDGVPVPELVRQLRAAVGAAHAACVHRGATSQDAVDTALMLRLVHATRVLRARLEGIAGALEALAARHGGEPVMARTRFQDALPMTLADRIATWTGPLRSLAADAPSRLPLQLGGPVGLRTAAFGPHHAAIASSMAQELGLADRGRAWHTDRRALGDISHWCASAATALGKLGLDVALMAQARVGEIRAPGGRSSSMAHKSNPVGAELLVTLARYVAGNAAMMREAALHENERSGIAWTLEWLALPPVLIGCGAATRAAAALVAGLGPGENGAAAEGA